MPAMDERVSLCAAGKQLGVGGGDIRRAGYTKVTTARPGAWEDEPPVWLHKAQARKRRSAGRAGGRPGGTGSRYRAVSAAQCARGGPAWSRATRTWSAAHVARWANDRTCPAGQAWCWYTCATSPDSSTATPTGSLRLRSGPVLP